MVSRYYSYAFVTTCEGAENLGIGFDMERRRSLPLLLLGFKNILIIYIYDRGLANMSL
jgi:hypothetical protein